MTELRPQMQQVDLQIQSLRMELAEDPATFEREMAALHEFIGGQVKLAFMIAAERKARSAA